MSKNAKQRENGEDSLDEYRRKRDFATTPEPSGEANPAGSGQGWSYLIQKHAASRLHYDLRLELDGVLKSWAVPKGPSLDPGEKRLAVQVEDHPLEYGDFEGVIPEGEYGGGTVLLWDRGHWLPEKLEPKPGKGGWEGGAAGTPEAARSGLGKGHLHFHLDGEKLHGGWHLVRMHGEKSDGGKNWLLMKEDDDHARPGDPAITEERPESVASGRGMDEIAADPERVWSSDGGEREPTPEVRSAGDAGQVMEMDASDLGVPDLEGARRGDPPDLTPQLPTRVERLPRGKSWVHEIKHDGYRLLAHVGGGGDEAGEETGGEAAPRVRLITRGGEDWTARFRPLADALAALPVQSAILDGEAVGVAADGRSDFSTLQKALSDGHDHALALYLFDLPYVDGWDLTATPLLERKEVLRELLEAAGADDATLRYSDHIPGRGEEVFRHACRMGLEGVVSKRGDRPYRPGRGDDWRKARCRLRQEMVIGGWVESEARGVRSLLLGYYPDEDGSDGEAELTYAGRVGTGFDQDTLVALEKRFRELATDDSPFSDPGAAAGTGSRSRKVHWLRPELVCEVEFAEWTAGGHLRHASFQGLREDKPPREVVREEISHEPIAPAADTTSKKTVKKGKTMPKSDAVAVAGVAISHPDRVVYPEAGLTKGDVATYYAAVAPRMLPHLEDRPLSLVRCPGGREECFYQKNVEDTFPDAVHRVDVEDEDGDVIHYAMVNDTAGLVSLIQMGVLEIHPWGARRDRLDRPDLLTFDLDPGPGVGWERMAEAAHLLHQLLEHLELVSFVKTSGGKGLHVVLPIDRRTPWDEAKAFTRSAAETLVRAAPDRFVATASKAKRKGKIFIDYLRNARGATSVAAYSTRAREGAPVSMPIAWDEVDDADPAGWTVKNTRQRIAAQKQDPWAGIYDIRQSLTQARREKLEEAAKG